MFNTSSFAEEASNTKIVDENTAMLIEEKIDELNSLKLENILLEKTNTKNNIIHSKNYKTYSVNSYIVTKPKQKK